uniref:INCENP_ARK-bind domain-containing protein n=1 Tax=Steinernema glaseri TaxID=37863 RepID=A0A1I7YEU0_9BILA
MNGKKDENIPRTNRKRKLTASQWCSVAREVTGRPSQEELEQFEDSRKTVNEEVDGVMGDYFPESPRNEENRTVDPLRFHAI